MKKVALIVAGGKGTRMNAKIPKQFLILQNLPILMHTIKQFSDFEEIFLVLPRSEFNYWNILCKKYNFNVSHVLVNGGETRFHSVKNGLDKIDNGSIVAIHDGVRPLVSKNLIQNLISKTKTGIGVIPIIPIKDSIRKVEGQNSMCIDRNNLHRIQTPQCFLSSDIKDAYKQKFTQKFTDEAIVLENNGGKIKTVLGEEINIKITTEKDLLIAEMFMQ
ncbi:MAG: 2-C-methyl-D-erythritol 4-phosphate cytidylyltransferase [Flavobacteriales bacterium]|nr:2-C-methyl-D-erythritol 4-phosphate cytidylyltransferase [Flavobacteriales bacterium]|tara:strand:+ start:44975 stop:45628 length:654 start_codon:yes stop_codon:yes gene_type:complete